MGVGVGGEGVWGYKQRGLGDTNRGGLGIQIEQKYYPELYFEMFFRTVSKHIGFISYTVLSF